MVRKLQDSTICYHKCVYGLKKDTFTSTDLKIDTTDICIVKVLNIDTFIITCMITVDDGIGAMYFKCNHVNVDTGSCEVYPQVVSSWSQHQYLIIYLKLGAVGM